MTGVLLLIPLSRKFLGRHDDKTEHEAKGKSLSQLIDEYQIISNLYRLRVLEDSALTENPLHDLQIPDRYHVNIVEVRRQAFQSAFLPANGQPDHGGLGHAGGAGRRHLRDGGV